MVFHSKRYNESKDVEGIIFSRCPQYLFEFGHFFPLTRMVSLLLCLTSWRRPFEIPSANAYEEKHENHDRNEQDHLRFRYRGTSAYCKIGYAKGQRQWLIHVFSLLFRISNCFED